MAALAMVVVFMKPRLPPRKTGPIIEWTAIRDIPYVLFVLGTSCLMAGVYFVFYYVSIAPLFHHALQSVMLIVNEQIASFARDTIGLSYTSSVTLVIVLNGVGLPARIIPGYIADTYVGVINLFIAILSVNVLLLYLWLCVHSISSFYAWTVLYGIAAGGFQSLFPTAITSLSDDMSRAGTRLGMAFTVIAFSALIGGPLGGAIVGAMGGKYAGAIAWAATSTLIGVALITAARVWKHGWTLKKKC